jgi:hypothetical protein
MRSEGAALVLKLRASKTDFSLPEPTLQAISACAGNTRLPSRRRSQSAIFFVRAEACARRKLVKGGKPTFHSGCGSVVLMHDAPETIAADDVAVGRLLDPDGFGRLKRESAVRTFAVVVLDVDAQDVFEMAAADDQEPVETLVADGADESLRVGVRLRRSHRRVDHLDSFAAEHLVEGSGELAIAIVDQETRPLENVREAEVARLLDDPVPDGFGVQPAKWTRRLPSSMKNKT